jgi:uncharacterized repeat protein (TIGR03803 family)
MASKLRVILLTAAAVVSGFLVTTVSAFAAGTEQVLYSLAYNYGTNPYAGLTLDAYGNLYGTISTGGVYGGGAVFELTPGESGQWSLEVLYSFCSVTGCTDGITPESELISDAAGNLYGTTSEGGVYSGCGHGCGTVFELTPLANGFWTETVLYSFTGGADGGTPLAGLIFDATGNLYGTTSVGGDHSSQFCGSAGCGVVFMLKPHTNGKWTEKVLHRFCSRLGCPLGASPNGVILDTSGNVYGTTIQGGTVGAGVVFRLSPAAKGAWTGKLLHTFGIGDDGANPNGVSIDGAGNLYGTTKLGGTHRAGTVFQLAQHANGKWYEKILHNFCPSTNCADGELPYAGVTLDASGNLYGTTFYGGIAGYGTVFKMTPGASGRWTETVIYDFLYGEGNPDAGLALDATGNLFSRTDNGGEYGFGTVFEVIP